MKRTTLCTLACVVALAACEPALVAPVLDEVHPMVGCWRGVIYSDFERTDSIDVLVGMEGDKLVGYGRWYTWYYDNPATELTTEWRIVEVGDEFEVIAKVGINPWDFLAVPGPDGLSVTWRTHERVFVVPKAR